MSYTEPIAARQPRPGPSSGGGTENVRGLLTTVLGEFVLPGGGSVWTQTMLRLLVQLGSKEKAARQAIARMHEGGWLERERVGRQTRWSLTTQSRQLLEEGAERIYGFGHSATAWDGDWAVVIARVPEADRHLRYRMGVGLRWAGFGSLGQGVWVCPWSERDAEAAELLANLGVDAVSFRGALGELGSATEVAHQAWDLDGLRAEYDAFLTLDAVRAAEGVESAAELTRLVHRWRRFPGADPELPTALLPGDWPGPSAVDRFAVERNTVLGPALAWWQMMESEAGEAKGSHAR